MVLRDVGDGLEGWAIAHPDFAGIEKRTETKIDSLLPFAHPALGSFRRHWPCNVFLTIALPIKNKIIQF